MGNKTRTVTPHGVETTDDPDDFAAASVYDKLNRPIEELTPFDKDDPSITTPDKTIKTYDAVGNLTQVSAPPSAGQNVRNITRYTYFDNGLARTSTDPWDIVTSYDYNPLGQQTRRTLTSAGGSSNRTMTWDYFPDGKLKSRSDDGVPVGAHVALVDNTDTSNTLAVGPWTESTAGSGYTGFNYHTAPAGAGANSFTGHRSCPPMAPTRCSSATPKASPALPPTPRTPWTPEPRRHPRPSTRPQAAVPG
ncbi:hypothetical protein AB0878_36800 [Amycolatopsis sp. NPDC047767]|uniref:hypothetical protein n=1 Tax=Amycolatopsis sp. NPDC047767 TaxID=3156765 RepID=UPI003456AF72